MLIKKKLSGWYDNNYKFILLATLIIVALSVSYVAFFYLENGDIMHKDVSLRGGTSLTINTDADISIMESSLKNIFNDISFRKLTEVGTGKQIAVIIETSASSDELKREVESLGIILTDENSSIEFTGASLSSGFYKQLLFAVILSFVFMSFVIFFLFKSVVPSVAIVFAAFSDIIIPLAILNLFGVAISSAGIAAFLMLIGYSVDTNILLTTRAIKRGGGTVNYRMFGAFKTGIMMTGTSLVAVLPAFLLITGLPDSFRQIFLILSLGLFTDIVITWLANASIIKWYCVKKNIK